MSSSSIGLIHTIDFETLSFWESIIYKLLILLTFTSENTTWTWHLNAVSYAWIHVKLNRLRTYSFPASSLAKIPFRYCKYGNFCRCKCSLLTNSEPICFVLIPDFRLLFHLHTCKKHTIYIYIFFFSSNKFTAKSANI